MTDSSLDKECIINSSNSHSVRISCGNKHIIFKNPSKKNVTTYDVDDCLLKSKSFKRCDRLSEIENSNLVFFIEFKGTNISHACKQIENTVKHYTKRYADKNKDCRIICTKIGHPKVNSQIMRSKVILKRYNASLKVHSMAVTVQI